MIAATLCRNVINDRTNRVRRTFKWGVENELVPATVLHALQAVSPLAGHRHTRRSYYRAIARACEKAGIEVWGPNRLRHSAATFLRKQYGIEAARVVLGHRSSAVTEVYAELDRTKAADIMAEVG